MRVEVSGHKGRDQGVEFVIKYGVKGVAFLGDVMVNINESNGSIIKSNI